MQFLQLKPSMGLEYLNFHSSVQEYSTLQLQCIHNLALTAFIITYLKYYLCHSGDPQNYGVLITD